RDGLVFLGAARRRRRPRRQPRRLGALLDGGGQQRLPAPGGPRWLRVDGGDVVPRREQRVERRHGEIRGSHEGDAHDGRVAGEIRHCERSEAIPWRGWIASSLALLAMTAT